jgi:hypothetical protein
LFGI